MNDGTNAIAIAYINFFLLFLALVCEVVDWKTEYEVTKLANIFSRTSATLGPFAVLIS